jgi:hypothetical protein
MNEENTRNYNLITLCVCVTLVCFAIIGGLSYYSIVDRNLMSQNIDRAIEKGVDPLSVRCSYAQADDIVCVAYASRAK